MDNTFYDKFLKFDLLENKMEKIYIETLKKLTRYISKGSVRGYESLIISPMYFIFHLCRIVH